MRKIVYAILILALLTLPVAAQEVPKAELFGGYQYTRVGGLLGTNGWNAAITGNVRPWFGVTADLSGLYEKVGGVGGSAQTFTFGPAFSLRGRHATPFVHLLVGGFHASAGFSSASASISGWVTILGGGVDVRINRSMAVRLIQGDWISWHAEGLTESKNGRISTGLVFRF